MFHLLSFTQEDWNRKCYNSYYYIQTKNKFVFYYYMFPSFF